MFSSELIIGNQGAATQDVGISMANIYFLNKKIMGEKRPWFSKDVVNYTQSHLKTSSLCK